MERRRALPAVERHPEQRAAAVHRRRRASDDVPATRRAYSNGNTFDYEGRQISCEHGDRRVVRYEHNGAVTVLAERYQGKRLNSPNDVVVHPRWQHLVHRSACTGSEATTKGSRPSRRSSQPSIASITKPGSSTMITDELIGPNGLCFSPDYKQALRRRHRHRPRHPRLTSTARRCATCARHAPLTLPGRPTGCRAPTACAATSTATCGRARGPGADHRAGRAADRDDSSAGDLRQRLLRRREAQPAVHGGQPVALRGLCRGTGRHVGTGAAPATALTTASPAAIAARAAGPRASAGTSARR